MIEVGRMDLLDVVEKEFFTDSIVGVGEGLEGQKVDGGGFVLGCMAGPFQCVTNLLHEMAHLVELEKERLLEFPDGGWGLIHGSRIMIGERPYYDMITDQAVLREARVWAYQVSLQRHYGIDEAVDRTVSSVEYIGSWHIFRAKHGGSESLQQRDRRALKVLADMVDRLSREEFSLENFRTSWWERIALLRAAAPDRGISII